MDKTTTSLTPLVWQETDLDEIAAVFERDGVVAVQGMLPGAAIDRADSVAERLLEGVDERPWAAGEEYCKRFDIWTKVFGGLEDSAVVALFDKSFTPR
jgi:hypothetical protein